MSNKRLRAIRSEKIALMIRLDRLYKEEQETEDPAKLQAISDSIIKTLYSLSNHNLTWEQIKHYKVEERLGIKVSHNPKNPGERQRSRNWIDDMLDSIENGSGQINWGSPRKRY